MTLMSEPANLLRRDAMSIWHPFTQHGLGRAPLPITGGKGALLHDSSGREYLDMNSSWWVNLHGHAHPYIIEKIKSQAEVLEHVMFAGFLHGHGRPELANAVADQILKLDHVQFAGATHEPAVRLAERLLEKARLSGQAKVFYSENGSTAVEVALKVAHQHWINKKSPRNLFATLSGGYHGDTLGAMSVGRSSGFFDSFTGMMFGTIPLPVPLIWNEFPNEEGEHAALQEAEEILKNSGSKIAGLIVEPLVQGAGGMRFHSPKFLSALCSLFQDHLIPVIFDEVMTGFGRTGTFLAHEQTTVSPDLICLSKGITGGILPLAVTLISDKLYESFLGEEFSTALAHGHSYTANPVSCAAALCSLDLHQKTDSLGQVRRINARMTHHLKALAHNPKVEKSRILGGIAAFDLEGSESGYSAAAGRELASYAQEHGLLIRPLGNVIYFMPPYCITNEEIDSAFQVICRFFDR